jgi:hypothetical protein
MGNIHSRICLSDNKNWFFHLEAVLTMDRNALFCLEMPLSSVWKFEIQTADMNQMAQ